MKKINVFICYTHEDEEILKKLQSHLKLLQRQSFIDVWYDREISAGKEWKQEIDKYLGAAEVILLLVSPDFMNSEYCYSIGMEQAMERHKRGEAQVIPIIVRPVYWQGTPLGKLQVLPTDGKPVQSSLWYDIDEALFSVAEGIRTAILELQHRYTPKQTESEPEAGNTDPQFWNIPYQRNPYFTGRQDYLEQLYAILHPTKASIGARPQFQRDTVVITGLGGVGKTQLVLAYAYHYYNVYRAFFWIHADTRETLLSDFLEIANLLDLPEKNKPEQKHILEAVKAWFKKHGEWLLIFDNADDLVMTQEFIPPLRKGHIVLTTRSQAVGKVGRVMEMDVLPPEEGLLFLLYRAGVLPLDAPLEHVAEADRTIANEIVQALGALPLALEQAGAYVQECGCSLSHYLDLYRRHHAYLLSRKSRFTTDYTDTVATTWSLSFQRVEHDNLVAAEMLRFCAFLHSDAIPEDIFVDGREELGPVLWPAMQDRLLLDEAIQTLRNYSFVRRQAETKTLSLHRLVQTVLRESLTHEQQHQWAERVVRVINTVFPRGVSDATTWTRCQQYLPHAQVCLKLVEQYLLTSPEAARLLHDTGWYLHARGWYKEVEPFYRRALSIRECTLGPEHLEVASSLDRLAELYHNQGKYSETEPLRLRVLAIREKVLGPEHPDIATSLYQLARLYFRQSKYSEAEQLHWRALEIKEKTLGPEDPSIADSLGNLGLLYHGQGKYAQAEPLYQRAFALRERIFGPEHLAVATSLINLGVLSHHLGKYTASDQFLQRALMIHQKRLGPEHPKTAHNLKKLGDLFTSQSKFTEAKEFYERALVIQEKVFGPENIDVALTLIGLGELYRELGQHTEAQSLAQRALPILEKVLGPENEYTLSARDMLL